VSVAECLSCRHLLWPRSSPTAGHGTSMNREFRMREPRTKISRAQRIFSTLTRRLGHFIQKMSPGQRLMSVAALMGLVLASVLVVAPDNGHDTPIPQTDLSNVHPDVSDAVGKARDQVREHPLSDSRWGHLGKVFMAHGWYAEAQSCFHEAARLGPTEFRWSYYQAVLQESEDLVAADRTYSQAVAMRPRYAPLRFRWAGVLLRLGKLEEAEDQFQQASRLAPREPAPRIGLGRAARGRNDLEDARSHLETAVALSPSSHEAHGELAGVYHLLGKAELASQELQRASATPQSHRGLRDPLMQDVENLSNTGRHLAMRADQLVMQGQLPAAIKAYQTLIQKRPDLARARMNLAEVLLSQGRQSEALNEYRNVIRLFPDDALAYFSFGYALERMGRSEAAIRTYEQAIELKPDYSQAHHALGRLQEQDGDSEAALNSYRQAVQADPRFAPAHLALGIALQNLRQLDAAIHHFRTAAQLAPDNSEPRNRLDNVLQQHTPPP